MRKKVIERVAFNHAGSSALAHEGRNAFRNPIANPAQFQRAGRAGLELSFQLGGIARRWLPAEQEIREGTEGKDIHRFARLLTGNQGLRREERTSWVFEQLRGVEAASEVRQPGETAVSEPAAGVPVVDLNARLARLVEQHKDALRRKCSMHDALVVRVADRIGKLPQQLPAGRHVELRALLRQVVVEALR